MNPFTELMMQKDNALAWELGQLSPSPEEEWQRLRDFVGLGPADFQAMVETVEVLFKRGHELVVGTYDYLLHHPETAMILGWERRADPDHLAERRRFFTVWLARTLGLDLSDDFARYLFRAGQLHAGHGPRQTLVPEMYVTGSISLVQATFARFLTEEMPGAAVVPAALAGWNKLLSMHLHLMLTGFHTAVELDRGDFAVPVSLFGVMRTITNRQRIEVSLPSGAPIKIALQKFFDYFPQARQEVFQINWEGGERLDAGGTPWFVPHKVFVVKPMWRVLLNGQDISFNGGADTALTPGDTLSIFPPGR